MSSATFAFKRFTVKQDRCAMKVSTDAVLLGAWVTPNGSKNILDIGTGTGVIALMIAQRTQAGILAIDIDAEATAQAAQNVRDSGFGNITVRHITLQDLAAAGGERFDLIVSNPPYFKDSLKSQDISRTMARHNEYLSFEDLLSGIKKLMSEKGRFCLILPTKEATVFRDMAEQQGLYLSKLLRIRTRPDKDSEKRHIMMFEYKQTEFSESTLVIETETPGVYTDEYKQLTRDYYVNF